MALLTDEEYSRMSFHQRVAFARKHQAPRRPRQPSPPAPTPVVPYERMTAAERLTFARTNGKG